MTTDTLSSSTDTRCLKCPLGAQEGIRTNCMMSRFQRKAAEKGGTSPLITLVIEMPAREDDGAGEAMTRAGYNQQLTANQAVWSVIDELKIDPNLVDVVPLVRCRVADKSTKLTDAHVKACLPWLWNTLRNNRPKLVIGMGATVTKYLTGHKTLKAARGHFGKIKLPKGFDPVHEDLIDIAVTTTVAPGAVYYQQTQGIGTGRNDLVSDLQAAWYRVNGLKRDARADYKWLESFEEIDAYLTHVEGLYAQALIPGVIVDVETNQHLDPLKKTGQLVSVGFSHKAWFGRAVMINHKEQTLWDLPGVWEAFLRRIHEFFAKVPTGGWNYKFDLRWMRKHLGVPFFLPPFFDGLLAHNAIFSELFPHDLKNASIQLLGSAIQEAEKDAAMHQLRQVYPENPERWHMGWIDKDVLLSYQCGDVDKTFQLYGKLDPLLDNDHADMPAEFQKKHPGFNHRPAYNSRMLAALLPFSEIEDNGLKVNRAMLNWMLREYPRRLEENMTPLLEHQWTKNVIARMRAEVEQAATDDELERVSKRNETEKRKAAEKPGYIPKVFQPRHLSELKVEYKKDTQAISYFFNLSRVLYEEAGVPAETLGFERSTRKGKGGRTSIYYPTGAACRAKIIEWATLNNRKDIADFVKQIEKVKKDEKLYSGYVVGMPDYIEADGLMHSTYNLSGARTGRASTTDPNMHAMPTRETNDPLAIIKMFESRWVKQGGLILALDYSAMELRIVAAISGEKNLIEAFENGIDAHKSTAAKMFNVPLEQVTPDQRRMAKTINFGILYGMSDAGLAARLGCSVEEAKSLIAAWFAGLPDLGKWIEKTKRDMVKTIAIKEGSGELIPNKRFRDDRREAKLPPVHEWARKLVDERSVNNRKTWINYQYDQHGYVTTVMGRKRILRNAGSWEYGLASKAERQAVNTPIQSIASDLALEATIRIHNRFKAEGLKSKVFGFIHDSIKADVFPGEFLQVFYIMKEEMEKRPKEMHDWLTVSVETSAEVGTGWGYHGEIEHADFEHNVFTFKADETNMGLIERALSTCHDLKLLKLEEIVEKEKVVGHKKTMCIWPKATGRIAA